MQPGIYLLKQGMRFLMAIDKKAMIILVLVFACGLLAGGILTGLISPQHVHTVKQVVYTDKAPQPIGPYSQAVQSGDYVFLSGQIGSDPATGTVTGTAEEQTTRAMENLRAVLQESGLGFGDVIQTRIYLVNMSDWTEVNGIYGSYFKDNYPARATVQVAGLPKGALVEIEVMARKR
jgi:2-iminobutanoate/2-iminopropanoate deaminase